MSYSNILLGCNFITEVATLRCEVRDLAQVEKVPVSVEVVDRALAMLRVDELGLLQSDRDLLSTLIDKFAGGPVGLNTLAASLAEEEATIEEVHEPYLLQLGRIERTPRGRKVSEKAYDHMKVSPSNRGKLL